jgi:hypothetical protein
MQNCPKCRHLWEGKVFHQQLSRSKAFVHMYYGCTTCDFVHRKTVRKGDHDKEYPLNVFKEESCLIQDE